MKRIVCAILILSLMLCVPLSSAQTARLWGDANQSGTVDAADALEVLKSVVGKVQLTDQQKTVGDLDGDGAISAADALVILRIVVGKE